MMKTYICPVCGFDGLDESAYGENFNPSYNICACCRFEFGYSEDHEVDLGYIVVPNVMKAAAFQLYRKQWMEKGAIVGHQENYPRELQNNGRVKKEVVIKQFENIKLDIDNLDFMMFENDGKKQEIDHHFWTMDEDIRAVTDKQIKKAEEQLGITLPETYKELLRYQDGGYMIDYVFPTDFPTSWAEDHIEIHELYGIGYTSSIFDSAYLIEEWDLPADIVIIAGDGHMWIALDYRNRSENPSVLLLDEEVAGIQTIAQDFEAFIDGFITDDGPVDWEDYILEEAAKLDDKLKKEIAEEMRAGRMNEEIKDEINEIVTDGNVEKIAIYFADVLQLFDAELEKYIIEQIMDHQDVTVREDVARHLAACAIRGFDTLGIKDVETFLLAMQEKERNEHVCYLIETGLSKLNKEND